MAAKLGEPAEIKPNTEVIPIVRLKAHLLPKTSQPKPQKIAPANNPIFCDRESKGGFPGLNSVLTGYMAMMVQQVTSLICKDWTGFEP